ncbi:SRPBCC family protein [Salipaludibacillus sp. HK11]|uniref:SRPBCC family protein n=1 Tax=Salipaludibacillus sp. HK11 TaxID=3394320 RepID=UPI0039FD2370
MEENSLQQIEKKVVFNATIDKVWKAISTSEGLESWFMPNTFKLQEGHEFELESPFGPSPCKVLSVEAPKQLQFSWDHNGWIVSFYLTEKGALTEFNLIHSGWKEAEAVIPNTGETQDVVRDRMNKGWDSLVNTELRWVVEN